MEQLAQSEFFYLHVAPNLTLVKFVFFLGIFGLVGVVAQSVRIAPAAEEREDGCHEENLRG
ncbi:MAG: hypothetical protein Q4D58_12305 [Synergistaceae bacterium]|nr:hypothetical protein [Synergistaceae bacterium]